MDINKDRKRSFDGFIGYDGCFLIDFFQLDRGRQAERSIKMLP